MKIVHIAPNAPYNDYWGYQDNLLPKYQKKLGHDVTMIVTNKTCKEGKVVETDCTDYVLNDGVRVIRLAIKKYPHIVLTNMNSRLMVYDYLKEIDPDFVFYHSLQGTTIFDVIRYKKEINPECIIVQDNHIDYNICNNPRGIKGIIIRTFQRYVNYRSIPYVSKVYGVTPWRKKYAEDYYHIPPDKTDILIMGADDEMLDFQNKNQIRQEIRNRFGFNENDFLIVTGGKIDKRKKIHFLLQACSGMKNVKLLVFGRVLDDIKDEFEHQCKENENIIYIGWIDSDKVYDYFFAADLVFFPGQHSVLWEQACASKVPCVFERWEGMEHVNNGGNSDFLTHIDVDSIRNKIEELQYTNKYYQMKKVAESDKTDIFLYSRIAAKSLECAKKE